MAATYDISADGRSITCKLCTLTSYHREDVRQHYCGNCHLFNDDIARYLGKDRRADIERTGLLRHGQERVTLSEAAADR